MDAKRRVEKDTLNSVPHLSEDTTRREEERRRRVVCTSTIENGGRVRSAGDGSATGRVFRWKKKNHNLETRSSSRSSRHSRDEVLDRVYVPVVHADRDDVHRGALPQVLELERLPLDPYGRRALRPPPGGVAGVLQPVARASLSGWSSKASDGVERRRGRVLKARDERRDAQGKVLKKRRSPRRRDRMGTSVR
jgi:hypothetical protein